MLTNYYGIEFRNPFAEQIDDYTEYYCSEMLMNALALYVVSNRPKQEHNSETLFKLLVSNSKFLNHDGECKSFLDALFDELKAKNPCAIELAHYNVFKAFPHKQQLSVIATLMASNFDVRKKMIDAFGKKMADFIKNPNDIFIPATE